MKPKRSHDLGRAFTLIEIMMVVAIVGLMMVMGLPSFLRVLKKEGMRKAEYDMLEACKEARRASIMGNKTTGLVIQLRDRTIEVPGAFKSEQIPDDIVIDTLGVNFVPYTSPETAQVRFFPNGTSDEFTILMHDGANYRKISLDTITALPVVDNIR